MMTSLKKPIVVMTAALAITLLASVNTTFAQVNFAETVVIPDTPTATSILVDPTITLNQNIGAIYLGSGSSVDAGEMALKSSTLISITSASGSPGQRTLTTPRQMKERFADSLTGSRSGSKTVLSNLLRRSQVHRIKKKHTSPRRKEGSTDRNRIRFFSETTRKNG